MDIFVFTQLDGTKTLIELLAPRTGLFAEVVALAGSRIIDTLNGADDSGSTASTALLEFGKLLDGNRTALNLHTHILSELDEALVGDRRQDGSALGGDVGVILDAEEVGCTSLIDIFLLFSIQIELASILTTMASCGMSLQAGSIVATDFIDTSAQRSAAVIVAGDNIRIGLESALEIRSDGSDEDEEQILVSGFDTHGDARTNQKRTEVEAGTSTVRRNETLIHLDNLDAHLLEALGAQFGHHDAAASALQAGSVLFQTEDANLAIFAAEGLQTLESLLAIVQAGCSHVDVDGLFGRNFNFTPLTVAVPAADIIIGFHITERKVLPINIHVFINFRVIKKSGPTWARTKDPLIMSQLL